MPPRVLSVLGIQGPYLIWDAKAASETLEFPTTTIELDPAFCGSIRFSARLAGFSGTIDFQASADNSNWFNVPYYTALLAASGALTAAQLTWVTQTVNVVYHIPFGPWPYFRIVMTRTAGTITARVLGSPNDLPLRATESAVLSIAAGDNNIGNVDIASALPAGTNLIGKVGIDQTTPGTTNKVINGKVLTIYNATGAAAIALSTTMAKPFRLLAITVHFSAAPTTSEALTVTLNANDGAAYDTLLKSINPSLTAATDIAYSPNHDEGEGVFESGDEVDVAFANTDTRTYGIRIVCEAL